MKGGGGVFGGVRGVRLRQGSVKVRVCSNGQFLCTLPKCVVDKAGVGDGSVLEFEFFSLDEVKGLSVQERLYHIAMKEGMKGVIMVSVL